VSGLSPFATRETPLRAHVVTQDPRVRSGLERVLVEQGLLTGDAADADVALVDLAPGAKLPSLSVPMVVLVDPGARPTELLSAGAAAVLPRGCAPDRLCAAILGAGLGLVVVDAEMARGALPEPRALGDEGETLTAREREVLTLVASGHSNRRIAKALGISEHTAKFFVGQILGKLGVSTRTEAVVVGARRGLIWL